MDILLEDRRDVREGVEREEREEEERLEREAHLLADESTEETAKRRKAEALLRKKQQENESLEETELRESKAEFELCSQSLAEAAKSKDTEARDRMAVLFIPSINRYITASLGELEHRKERERQNAIKNTKVGYRRGGWG